MQATLVLTCEKEPSDRLSSKSTASSSCSSLKGSEPPSICRNNHRVSVNLPVTAYHVSRVPRACAHVYLFWRERCLCLRFAVTLEQVAPKRFYQVGCRFGSDRRAAVTLDCTEMDAPVLSVPDKSDRVLHTPHTQFRVTADARLYCGGSPTDHVTSVCWYGTLGVTLWGGIDAVMDVDSSEFSSARAPFEFLKGDESDR